MNITECVEYIKTLFKPNSRVVVAMSGGIDSSFTAAIIKRAGFETIGITLQLYRSEAVARGKTCCAGKDIQDAKNVANSEGFAHYVLDYTQIFQKNVIDDFVNTYEAGKTPIPCGRCNQYIKFGHMLDFAKSIDADYMVTGHYAQKFVENDEHMLMKGEDEQKDQSYFLALTTLEQLKMLHFPLAKIPKTLVRKLANEIGLSVAAKAESQDICFIPDGDYRGFLKKIRPEMFKTGIIVCKKYKLEKDKHTEKYTQEKIEKHDENDWQILGEHTGLANYTIGQRKNLGLSNGPWYVVKLNIEENILIVAKENEHEEKFLVEETNLLVDQTYFFEKEIGIQIRARNKAALGTFDPKTNIVKFLEPQSAITPGQICAFYDGKRLIGGSIIKERIIR